jgi:hypothetical protein
MKTQTLHDNCKHRKSSKLNDVDTPGEKKKQKQTKNPAIFFTGSGIP